MHDFYVGDKVKLLPNWREQEGRSTSYAKEQLFPKHLDTVFTIRELTRGWLHLDWVEKDGRARGNAYAPCQFKLFIPSQAIDTVLKNTEANPKQAYGDKKVPLQLVPPAAIVYMGIALKEGARKYGAYNWRDTEVEAMTYIGAAMRHIGAYLDGEDMDSESDNPHLAHAMASLAILIDAEESGKLIDNRPPAGPMPSVLQEYSQ